MGILKFVYTHLVAALAISMAFAAPKPPLALIHTGTIPEVDGDFDHFAADVKGNRLFLTAEDHHSVEVFELSSGKWLRSVSGFSTPHSVLYIPEKNELFVVDGGDGTCKILRGDNYKVIGSLAIAPEADSMVYDPSTKQMFVSAGGGEAKMNHSLLVVIDTTSGKKVGETNVSSENIEAMAVEKSGSRLFANIRDKHQIGVFDRKKLTLLQSWTLDGVQLNTSMAFDEANHRILIVGRKPGKVAIIDSNSGKLLATFPCVDGGDDMALDLVGNRLYVTGAEGFVTIFSRVSPDHYEMIGRLPTGFRGKNSILVPELKQFYVAHSKHENKPAELQVYRVE